MNLSFLLAQQITVMGIMILFGFIVARVGLITLEDSSCISKMVLYLICPCTIFSAMCTEFSWSKAVGFFIAMVAALVINLLFVIIAHWMGRQFRLNPAEEASIAYSNCGNLVIPIVNYVLGAEYVLYTAAFMMIQTLLIWTHGLSLVSGESQADLKKIVKNPNVIATLLGLVVFFARIEIPEIPLSAAERIGDCVGPVSMIVVGIMLGNADLKTVFSNIRTWAVCLIRLIICPLAVLAIMWITRATHINADAGNVLFISFLASAAPSASTISQMANVYHKNEIQAGCINMMSVVLCMVTIPIMTVLYSQLCL